MPKRLPGAYSVVSTALLAVASLGLVGAFAQSAPPKPVPMTKYVDPDGDVSFEYPAVWKIDNAYQSYLAPHILQGDISPRVKAIFLPAGTYYAKTNLLALDFVYVKAQTPSQEACSKLAVGDMPAKVETPNINGVSFQHFDLGEAGMCHGIDQHVYWTYRNGTCYLFEGDKHTSCAGAYPGQRDLTETERQALNRHLNAIPQSIQFMAGK